MNAQLTVRIPIRLMKLIEFDAETEYRSINSQIVKIISDYYSVAAAAVGNKKHTLDDLFDNEIPGTKQEEIRFG